MRKLKKNSQYYKSRSRVLKYKDPTEAQIKALRVATQTILSAIEIAKAQATPVPNFIRGGIVPVNAGIGIAGMPVQGPEIIMLRHITKRSIDPQSIVEKLKAAIDDARRL
jgi:hypothetical protein